MVKKLEVEFLNYREDEYITFGQYLYRFEIALDDNIIIKDIIKVNDNDNLSEIVNEIIKKIRIIYGKKDFGI